MRRALALLGLLAAATAACSAGSGADGQGVSVVVSAYPLEWLAERVGGQRVSITNVTPPGVEPHDVELNAPDLATLEEADLVVVVGGGFQPGIEDAAARRAGTTVTVLEQLDGPEGDPHFWLDPLAMARGAELLAERLSAIDPVGAATYASRAAAFTETMRDLDGRIERTIGTCERDLVVASHEAYTWFAVRYGLRLEGIAGTSPENEPTAERLAELRNEIARTGVTTIFTEPLTSSRVAETLAHEAGVETAVLDPIEGLTDEQRTDGQTYLSVMGDNLVALARGLDCTIGAG